MQVVTDGFKNGTLEIVSDTLTGRDKLAAVLDTVTGQYWVVDFTSHAKLAGGMDLEMAVDLVDRLRRVDRLTDPADCTAGWQPANTRVVFPYDADETREDAPLDLESLTRILVDKKV